jgi:hypothetical protein
MVKIVVDRGLHSLVKNAVSDVTEKLGLSGMMTKEFLEEVFNGIERGRDDLVGKVVNTVYTGKLDVAKGMDFFSRV